jgi:hypothetical protein
MNKNKVQRNKIFDKCCCNFCNNSIKFDINTKNNLSKTGSYCLLQDLSVSKDSYCLEFENKGIKNGFKRK